MAAYVVLVRDSDEENTAYYLYEGSGVTDIHFFKNEPDSPWSSFTDRYSHSAHGIINQFCLFD